MTVVTAAGPAARADAVLRIALIGLSGSGKSTCAGFIRDFAAARGLAVTRVPLAAPLYRLQEQVYAAAGVLLAPGAQDQVLLEALAAHLRRINPQALAADFRARLAATDTPVVVNDDLRDPHVDAPALCAAGFRVLRVRCAESVRMARLKQRADLTRSDESTSGLHLITADADIDNSGDLTSFRAAVEQCLEDWL